MKQMLNNLIFSGLFFFFYAADRNLTSKSRTFCSLTAEKKLMYMLQDAWLDSVSLSIIQGH